MRPDDADRYFLFIFGAPRSGTTFIANVLGSIENSLVIPESQFIRTILAHCDEAGHIRDVGQLLEKLEKDIRFQIWGVSSQSVKDAIGTPETISFYDFYLAIVAEYASTQGVDFDTIEVVIDHTPTATEYVTKLETLIHKTGFIHLVRDGRAAAASVLSRDWGILSPEEAAAFWAKHIAAGLLVESLLEEKTIRIHYEQFIQADAHQINAMLQKLGLGIQGDLTYDNFKLPGYTQNQHQLVSGKPDPSRVDAWKRQLEPRAIELMEFYSGTVLNLLGYKPLYWPHCKNRSLVEHFMRWVSEPIQKYKHVLRRRKRFQALGPGK